MSTYDEAVELVKTIEEKEWKLAEWDSYYFTFLVKSQFINAATLSSFFTASKEIGYTIEEVKMDGKKLSAERLSEIPNFVQKLEIEFRRNFKNFKDNNGNSYFLSFKIFKQDKFSIITLSPLGKMELFNDWIASEWLRQAKYIVNYFRPLYGYLDMVTPSSLGYSPIEFLLAKYRTQSGSIPSIVVFGRELLKQLPETKLTALNLFSIETVSDSLFIVLDPFWIQAFRANIVTNDSKRTFEKFLKQLNLKDIFTKLDSKST